MDWFERITGFKERQYHETQSALSVQDGRSCSKHSTREPRIGRFEMPSLDELRERTHSGPAKRGRTRLSTLQPDVRRLHSSPSARNALFQVASQFNLLEMPSPAVTPEHGVSSYVFDRTQGPACAIAAGAGRRRSRRAPIRLVEDRRKEQRERGAWRSRRWPS